MNLACCLWEKRPEEIFKIPLILAAIKGLAPFVSVTVKAFLYAADSAKKE